MVKFSHSQTVAWTLFSGAYRGISDCSLAVVGLVAAGWCLVEGLHLAAVWIRHRDSRGLAIDSTLDSLGTIVEHDCPSAERTSTAHGH